MGVHYRSEYFQSQLSAKVAIRPRFPRFGDGAMVIGKAQFEVDFCSCAFCLNEEAIESAGKMVVDVFLMVLNLSCFC